MENCCSQEAGLATPAFTTTTANSFATYNLNNGSCPNCGYCPCCGRSNKSRDVSPYTPYYGGLQYYSGSKNPNTVYCDSSLGAANAVSISDLSAVEKMLNG